MCDHSYNCVDEGRSENNTVVNMIHQRMLNFHLGPQAQRTSYKSIVLHLRANMSRNISMSGLTLFLGKCLSTKLIGSFQHMVLGIKTNSLYADITMFLNVRIQIQVYQNIEIDKLVYLILKKCKFCSKNLCLIVNTNFGCS